MKKVRRDSFLRTSVLIALACTLMIIVRGKSDFDCNLFNEPGAASDGGLSLVRDFIAVKEQDPSSLAFD